MERLILDFGLWSLTPPLVALTLALATRKVVFSLASGCLAGAIVFGIGTELERQPEIWSVPVGLLNGIIGFVRDGVIGQPANPGNAQILVLIFLIGGFVHLLEQSGGIRSFSAKMVTMIKTPKQLQLATFASGLAIFFSDLGNTLILGPIFRPLYDRFGISREKLAYIIDSTAAPVCVMIPFIGWGVYISGLLDGTFLNATAIESAKAMEQLPSLFHSESGEVRSFQMLAALIPYQLYPILTLITVPIVASSSRLFGPMARCSATEETTEERLDGDDPSASVVVVPLLVLLATMAALMILFSRDSDGLKGGEVKTAIASAYLLATVVGGWLLSRTGVCTSRQAFVLVRDGMGKMMGLAIIIVLAWTLGDLCKDLGTGAVISSALDGGFPPQLLPALVMVLGAIISFATGTSFGTFAILLPLVIPLAINIDAPILVTISAVLSGGIIGDHTSPISDTTLLASMGAGAVHADHVSTQLPYATMVGAVALVGFLVAGFFPSPLVTAGAGVLMIVTAFVLLRLLGVPDHTASTLSLDVVKK